MFEQLTGLVESPRPMHLFVEVSKNEDTGQVFGWHTFDNVSKKATNIGKPALKGVIQYIRMRLKEFQDKKHYKIEFGVMSGDRQWVIRSGVDTVFTRGLVLQLTKFDLFDQKPEVTILAEPRDATVMGSVWHEGKMVKADWDPDVKLFDLIVALQKRLGQEPQTIQSIAADFEKERAK